MSEIVRECQKTYWVSEIVEKRSSILGSVRIFQETSEKVFFFLNV